MNKGVVAAIVALLVIGGGVVAFTSMNKDDEPTTETTTTTQTTTDTNSGSGSTTPAEDTASDEETIAATITYGANGFSPATVTVKSGDTIRIVNASDSDLDFASNDHPVHTDNSELNVGVVAEDGSETFMVTRAGTWGYHNHENDSHTGTIVVQ